MFHKHKDHINILYQGMHTCTAEMYAYLLGSHHKNILIPRLLLTLELLTNNMNLSRTKATRDTNDNKAEYGRLLEFIQTKL